MQKQQLDSARRKQQANFAAQCLALRTFFGLANDLPLADSVAEMNRAMGLAGDGALPAQVRALVQATGVRLPEPAAAAAGGGSSAAAGGMPLGHPDPKLTKYLARHAARAPTLSMPVDERALKIRTYQESLQQPSKHADFSTEDGTQERGCASNPRHAHLQVPQ